MNACLRLLCNIKQPHALKTPEEPQIRIESINDVLRYNLHTADASISICTLFTQVICELV
jgi:hypothetical protein